MAPAALEADLRGLPRIQTRKYNVDPYLRAAMSLQRQGKEQALSTLQKVAADGRNDTEIIALCRMLFDPRPKQGFRRPQIGGAVFVGTTSYSEWPREPIELVDEVPFCVVEGYTLAGEPESATEYLRYCIRECDWRDRHYRPKSDAEKAAALSRLMSSPKWKQGLGDRDREFLAAQIK